MTKKNWVVFGVIALALLIFLEIYTKYDHPSFFRETIEEFKNDKKLMTSIGGFKSFEYEFNKNELDKDTLNFIITIIGKEKKILCTGMAIKDKQQDWAVIKKDTIIKDDF